jgi:hypothetical protein
MANNKKINFKDVKLGQYKGKGFILFSIIITIFIALSFFLSLGTKGTQHTLYNPPKTDKPNDPKSKNDDEVHAMGEHNWD